MTNKRPGPKKFTPTTIVLIVLLLGAVAGASRLVSPPPPGPPEPPKKADAQPGSLPKDEIDRKNKEAAERMEMTMKREKDKPAVKPVADPNAMTIDNSYFWSHKPGNAGLKQTDEEMKKKTAAYAAWRKQQEEATKNGSNPSPSAKPKVAPIQ